MSKNYKPLYWYLAVVFAYGLAIFSLIAFTGCLQQLPNGNSHIDGSVPFGPEWFDSLIEIAHAFSLANTASAPVNPYYFPIGVALAGLSTMLEALRRKEKSGRKHAEHELNNGNNNK